jgi:hypothetical protein
MDPCFWVADRMGREATLPIQVRAKGVRSSGIQPGNTPFVSPSMNDLRLEQVMPLKVGVPGYHVFFNTPQTSEGTALSTITISRMLITAN